MQKENNQKLSGVLYKKNKACGKLLSITYPEGFPDIFVVDAQKLGKANSFDVYGHDYPVFAKDEVLFPSQPLFAVFGPEEEDVELFINQVVVNVEPCDTPMEPETKSFFWNKGEAQAFLSSEDESFEKVSSKFSINRFSEILLSDKKVSSSFENNVLSVDTETFWPIHTKETLAKAFDLNPENVNIITQEAHMGFDPLAFKHLVLCIATAFTAINKGCKTEISDNVSGYHPQIDYQIDSLIDKTTSEIVVTKANVSLDMGAVFVLEEEMASSIFAGLTSMYKNQVTEIEVNISKSNNSPSNLFRGLGFASSVAAMENHITHIARVMGKKPDTWRLENIAESDNANIRALLNVSDLNLLKDSLQKCSQEAEFSRKFFVYNQKNISGQINPALNYTRGIGIASAGGISGFSSMFSNQKNYSLEVVLNEDNSIVINCGMYANENTQASWKKIVKDTFPEVPINSIAIRDIGDGTIDLGPAILSRSETIIPNLIEKACLEIADKRNNNEPYPIKANPVTFQNNENNTLYNMNCFGTITIDLYIDPIVLIPVIYNIDAFLAFGKIRNKEQLKKDLRQIISQTIRDVCPDASIDYTLNLSISENQKYNADSSTTVARGITMAALSTALSQALNHYIYKLPISAEDILGIIKNNEADQK